MARKVIGPTGSRRRRWLFLCTTIAALAVAALFISGAGAIVSGSPSNFESVDAPNNASPPVADGNMTNDATGHSDWNCFANGGSTDTTGFVKSGITVGSTCSSNLVKANAVAKPDPAATTSDDSWVNGQKMDSPCAQLATNKNPGKDDFTEVASYNETLASNKHTYLYGATVRVSPNGSASENVELNQVAGTAACPITRTAGDHLLAFDYQNGGTSLDLHVLTWIDAAHPTLGNNNGTCIIKNDTMPCWGANVIQPGAASFEGDVSQSAITAAKNGINGQALVAGEFAEFGVDLTTALQQDPNACNTTSQVTWESRSSGSSFSSNPEDISIEKKTVTNCGEVKVIKHTDPRGIDKSFTYTSNLAGSEISCSQGAGTATSFSLNDKNNTTADNAANTQDCTSVPASSYTVTEGSHSGYTLSGLSCDASSGSSGSQDATTPEQANITLAAGGVVTCTYTNHLNTSSLATQASSTSSVTPGTGVHDTATVTGDSVNGSTPSGSVTFYLCGPLASATGCTSSGTKLTPDGTLSGSGITATATSPTVNSGTGLSPGIYCFAAYWSGDTNYPAANSTTATNECFTVSKIDTSTVTTPNDGSGVTGAESTITLGGTIYDTAVVSGTALGGAPTGSVAFHVCGPISSGTCTTGGSDLGSAGLSQVGSTNTSSATSAGFTPAAVGRYCFRGDYGGSTIYNTSSDSSLGECFTVTDTTGSTSAQTWLPNDSGTVTAAHGAPLNGTLSIQLYTGDNCGVTSGSAVSGQLYSKTLTNATTAATRTLATNNSTFAVSTSTSVSWLVSFTSTDSNVGNSSHCESTSLTITN